jgi:hypothetical protein
MQACCGHCGKKFEILTGHYNRAVKRGLKVYCSRKHAGLGRRVYQTDEDKKLQKFWYDQIYRLANIERIKKLKKEYFDKDYSANPDKYKKERQRRAKEHAEYCRQPEYRKYKKGYDRKHRANKVAGPMADAYLVLLDLQKEIDIRAAKSQNGIINKSKKRKRQWQQVQKTTQTNLRLLP